MNWKVNLIKPSLSRKNKNHGRLRKFGTPKNIKKVEKNERKQKKINLPL
jgi:hypothetical protein